MMKHPTPSAEQMLKPNLWAPIPMHRSSSHRSRQLNLRTSAHGNTFGHSFRVTTFGESHGKGVGCVIDGVPPRLPITKEDIQVLSQTFTKECVQLCQVAKQPCIARSPADVYACLCLQAELDRRRPGQSRITTPRKESDTCEIYSGEPQMSLLCTHGSEVHATGCESPPWIVEELSSSPRRCW